MALNFQVLASVTLSAALEEGPYYLSHPVVSDVPRLLQLRASTQGPWQVAPWVLELPQSCAASGNSKLA